MNKMNIFIRSTLFNLLIILPLWYPFYILAMNLKIQLLIFNLTSRWKTSAVCTLNGLKYSLARVVSVLKLDLSVVKL